MESKCTACSIQQWRMCVHSMTSNNGRWMYRILYSAIQGKCVACYILQWGWVCKLLHPIKVDECAAYYVQQWRVMFSLLYSTMEGECEACYIQQWRVSVQLVSSNNGGRVYSMWHLTMEWKCTTFDIQQWSVSVQLLASNNVGCVKSPEMLFSEHINNNGGFIMTNAICVYIYCVMIWMGCPLPVRDLMTSAAEDEKAVASDIPSLVSSITWDT